MTLPGRDAALIDDAVAKFRQAEALKRCLEYADAELNRTVVALPIGTMTRYIDATQRIIDEAG